MKIWYVYHRLKGESLIIIDIGFGETEQEAIASVPRVVDKYAYTQEIPLPDGWELRRKEPPSNPFDMSNFVVEEDASLYYIVKDLVKRVNRLENPPRWILTGGECIYWPGETT